MITSQQGAYVLLFFAVAAVFLVPLFFAAAASAARFAAQRFLTASAIRLLPASLIRRFLTTGGPPALSFEVLVPVTDASSLPSPLASRSMTRIASSSCSRFC